LNRQSLPADTARAAATMPAYAAMLIAAAMPAQPCRFALLTFASALLIAAIAPLIFSCAGDSVAAETCWPRRLREAHRADGTRL